MFRILLLFLSLALSGWLFAQNNGVFFVEAGDNDGLIDAINMSNQNPDGGVIFISEGPGGQRTFSFDMGVGSGESALPLITNNVSLAPLDPGTVFTFERSGTTNNLFRLAEVSMGGRLSLGRFNIEGFSASSPGGGVLVSSDGRISLVGTRFRNNFSSADGGAVAVSGTGSIFASGTEFINNRSPTLGGAISITGMGTGNIGFTSFQDNSAGVFGCDLNLSSSSNGDFGNTLTLLHNTFAGNCDNVLIENPVGRIVTRGNTFGGAGDAIDSTDTVALFGNLFGIAPSNPQQQASKATCNDFGSGAFMSQGFNISTDTSCALDQATDQPGTDPMLAPVDTDGVFALQAGSPAIDAGAVEITSPVQGKLGLPCGYKDARGLGRPQDADGDGVFECDIGSYEVQGGDDLGPAASAAYFDVDRNGEGVFVELLGHGAATAAKFTYTPDGTGAAWFVGVGNVVGNSIVFDDMFQPQGTAFGTAFDPQAIVNQRVGAMSLNFPSCAQVGRQAFQADLEGDFEDLLVNPTRITSIVNCDGTTGDDSGRSGSFFNPDRDGEGIFVQWLTNGQVVVIWYTFDPAGNQIWIVSDAVTVQGNTVTANMLYPTSFTGFGSAFDPDQITLSPWGTVTLTYQPGCNDVDFSFSATAPGYGAGAYDYTRLTSLTATQCDL